MRKTALVLRRRQLSPAAEGCLSNSHRILQRARTTSSPSSLDPLTTSSSSSFSSSSHLLLSPRLAPSPFRSLSLFSTAINSSTPSEPQESRADEMEGEEWLEEEDYADPVLGDGGGGGGIVLGDVAWGERALTVAREVLLQCGDDLVIYAFKISPKGYVYVRLDKLTDKYGCPSMEEIMKFNNLYKKRLDEMEESGVAIEVSSPGAERLLKVPEDLDRFKELPMWVQYLEGSGDSKHQQVQEKVFLLESIDTDANTGCCVWKLADVKENRAELGKGRPLSRKHKDWRLTLPFTSIKRVMLFLNTNG